jgi:hypothetical protein
MPGRFARPPFVLPRENGSPAFSPTRRRRSEEGWGADLDPEGAARMQVQEGEWRNRVDSSIVPCWIGMDGGSAELRPSSFPGRDTSPLFPLSGRGFFRILEPRLTVDSASGDHTT